MGRVEGKVALVAGAGGGIGGAGAEALAREGAAVICADIDVAAAEATAAHIRAAGGGPRPGLSTCATARRSMPRWRRRCASSAGSTCCSIAPASASARNFLDLDPATWDRIIAVNLTGMFHLGQAAARQMVRQGGGGSIINVTSQLAEVARPERAAYVASKGGGRSLTHAMAVDLAAHGIRVNAIAPGPTLTGLTRASYADPETRRATMRRSRWAGSASPRTSSALSSFSPPTNRVGDRQHGHGRRRLSGCSEDAMRTEHARDRANLRSFSPARNGGISQLRCGTRPSERS